MFSESLQRLGDIAGPAALAVDVGDLDAVDRERRTVHLIAQADVLFERGHQGEHLERRPGLQTRLSEVETIGVRTAVVGADRPVVRVDGHHGCPHVGVLAVQVFRYRLLRRLLRLGIDGGGDLQALGVQGLLVDVEQLHQLFGHLAFDQAVGTGRLVLRAGLVGWHRRRKHLRRTITGRQGLGFHHAVEHPVPPGLSTLGIHRGVQ